MNGEKKGSLEHRGHSRALPSCPKYPETREDIRERGRYDPVSATRVPDTTSAFGRSDTSAGPMGKVIRSMYRARGD